MRSDIIINKDISRRTEGEEGEETGRQQLHNTSCGLASLPLLLLPSHRSSSALTLAAPAAAMRLRVRLAGLGAAALLASLALLQAMAAVLYHHNGGAPRRAPVGATFDASAPDFRLEPGGPLRRHRNYYYDKRSRSPFYREREQRRGSGGSGGRSGGSGGFGGGRGARRSRRHAGRTAADTAPDSSRHRSDVHRHDWQIQPLVSVVMPYREAHATLRTSVASVLRQSLAAFELLIVDDHSTSAAADRALAWAAHEDARVRIVRLEEGRRGLSAARNAGFEQAAAHYVMMLDADDQLEPTVLEKSAWFLHTHPTAGFVKGYTVGFGAQEYIWTKGFSRRDEFLVSNTASEATMVRRSHWLAVGGFDETMTTGLEDYEFWLRSASAGVWGGTLRSWRALVTSLLVALLGSCLPLLLCFPPSSPSFTHTWPLFPTKAPCPRLQTGTGGKARRSRSATGPAFATRPTLPAAFPPCFARGSQTRILPCFPRPSWPICSRLCAGAGRRSVGTGRMMATAPFDVGPGAQPPRQRQRRRRCRARPPNARCCSFSVAFQKRQCGQTCTRWKAVPPL